MRLLKIGFVKTGRGALKMRATFQGFKPTDNHKIRVPVREERKR
jgi:hypothetical protein